MAKIDRKKLILEEAARLFSAKRFDEVLMDDIAHQAGVGKGTIYTYFADKEELYFAVVFEGIRRLNEQLQRKANRQPNPEDELRRMVHAIVSFFSQNRFFFRLMSQEDGKSEGGRGENRKRWRENDASNSQQSKRSYKTALNRASSPSNIQRSKPLSSATWCAR